MRNYSLISTKINIKKIIQSHIATMYNAGIRKGVPQKPMRLDLITFFIYPLIITLIIILLGIRLDNNSVDIICTALSIFVGLLFNVTVLLITLKRKTTPGKDAIDGHRTQNYYDKNYNTVILETHSNISFAILVSILAILTSFMSLPDNVYLKTIFSFISVYLYMVFLFTLFMSIKRMYGLIESDINKPIDNDDACIEEE